MLDFGWAELLILVAVAVFVIGPKDIPNIMYGLGRGLRRLQYIRFAISQQFDEIMNTGDIEELRKGVNFEQNRHEGAKLQEAEADEDIEAHLNAVAKESDSADKTDDKKEIKAKDD